MLHPDQQKEKTCDAAEGNAVRSLESSASKASEGGIRLRGQSFTAGIEQTLEAQYEALPPSFVALQERAHCLEVQLAASKARLAERAEVLRAVDELKDLTRSALGTNSQVIEEMRAQFASMNWQLSGMWSYILDLQGSSVPRQSAASGGRAPSGAVGGRAAKAERIYFHDDANSESDLEIDSKAVLRPVKLRQVTAFARGSERKVNFGEEDYEEQEDIRTRKKRQGTAFVRSAAGAVSFVDEPSDEEVQVESSSQLRPTKKRQATAFAPRGRDARIEFDDDPSESEQELDEAAGKTLRPSKGRQKTGFVKPRRPIFVKDGDDVIEVCLEESQKQLRSAKSRQPTAFVAKSRGVAFQDGDVETAEVEVEGCGRSSKKRQGTAFAPARRTDSEVVRFDDEEASREELVVEGDMKPVKHRQATAFVKSAKVAVEFDDERSESEEEIDDTHGLRPCKQRQATSFPKAKPKTHVPIFVQDGDQVYELTPVGKDMRSAKTRQATGFIRALKDPESDEAQHDDTPSRNKRGHLEEPGGAKRVAFNSNESIYFMERVFSGGGDLVTRVDIEPAGRSSDGRVARAIKKRQVTAFVPKAKAVVLDSDASESEQEVEAEVLRPVKGRQVTAHVPRVVGKGTDDSIPGSAVSFVDEPSESEQELDESASRKMRSCRIRQVTAFHREGRGAKTGAVGDVLYEVEAVGPDMRSAKQRQPTRFAEKAAPEDDDGVSFDEDDRAPAAKTKSTDERVPSPSTAKEDGRQPATRTKSSDRRVATSDQRIFPASRKPSSQQIPEILPVTITRSISSTTGRAVVTRTLSNGQVLENRKNSFADTLNLDGTYSLATGRRSTRVPTTFGKRPSIDSSNAAWAGENEESQSPAGQQLARRRSTGSEGSGVVRHDWEKDDFCLDVVQHLVGNLQKDEALIRRVLTSLYFFSEVPESDIAALVRAMQVFEFEDGMDVTRQGSTKGTHFFIVASGKFNLIKNGIVKGTIHVGQAFGEAVLLHSGAQSATVRAVGRALAYGMSGPAMREALEAQYEVEHGSANAAIDRILAEDRCALLRHLSSYQVQQLYDHAAVCTLEEGARLSLDGSIHFVLQGSVVTMSDSGVSRTVKGRSTILSSSEGLLHQAHEAGSMVIVGDMPWLGEGSTSWKVVAGSSSTKILSLSRALVQDMFGEKLEEVLITSRLIEALRVLCSRLGCAKPGMDRLEAMAKQAKLMRVNPGTEAVEPQTCLAVCLRGSVNAAAKTSLGTADAELVQVAGVAPRRLDGVGSTFLGDELLVREFVEKGAPSIWDLHLESVPGVTNPSTVAVWHDSIELRCAMNGEMTVPHPGERKARQRSSSVFQKDKVSALMKVIVLRSLSPEQFYSLAAAMEVVQVKSGEYIFKEGDDGKHLFIIHYGQVQIMKGEKGIRNMGLGDYFGERALLFDEPRSASVISTEDCELWKMGKRAFDSVVKGPILAYMRDRVALQNTTISLSDLECMRIVGRGGFGVVKMVRSKIGVRYALKCVSKRHAIKLGQVKGLAMERDLLAEIDHPFMIKYVKSFQGPKYVYFLMELVTGGELLDALQVLGLLKTPQIRFYTGSLVLALEYLHERRIAYLDLKGENCLIDQYGYVKIIDFGVAETVKRGRLHAVKGTPLYMAPEVISGKGYSTFADLWSLGVVMYDFCFCRFPFGDENASQAEVFRAVLKQPLSFPGSPKCEPSAKLLMKELLCRDMTKRPGAGPSGFAALKGHQFFDGFSWDMLLSRQLEPPYTPEHEVYGEDSNEGNKEDMFIQASAEAAAEDDLCTDDWVDPDPSVWDGF